MIYMRKTESSFTNNYGVKHLAIIMDGNGRWAKLRNKPRTFGHQAGFKTIFNIAKSANKRNIEVLSVYAFSTENWNRPKKEIDFLWSTLEKRIVKETKTMLKNNIRLTTMGDLSRLPQSTQKALVLAKEETCHCSGLKFNICLNYGGRDEIVRAVKEIASKFDDKQISVDDITEQLITNNLDSKDFPDVDLLIRTSGEQRLSNYMLWQLSYAEFIFNNVMWPDYTNEILEADLITFAKRKRRFGTIDGK